MLAAAYTCQTLAEAGLSEAAREIGRLVTVAGALILLELAAVLLAFVSPKWGTWLGFASIGAGFLIVFLVENQVLDRGANSTSTAALLIGGSAVFVAFCRLGFRRRLGGGDVNPPA